MNNSELDSILKKAQTPQPPKEFWEEFPQRIARELNRGSDVSIAKRVGDEVLPPRNWFPRLTWGFTTVVCILAAFAVGYWHGQTNTKTAASIAPGDILENTKFVRETLTMFPNRVRAIVKDKRGLNLILSEEGNVPSSPPLYVRVCDGKDCSSFVTFSGQEIQIDGRRLTVLSDSRGGIILEGNEFVWSSDEQVFAKNHLKIEAKSLGTMTL